MVRISAQTINVELGECKEGRSTAQTWLDSLSRVRDRILVIWVPNERCTPEQAKQTNTPKFTDAHSGSTEL